MTFLEQVCVHEASHAYAAYRHGAELTFLQADGYLDECRVRHPGNFGSDPEKIKESILIFCAGPAGEMRAVDQPFASELYVDEMKDLVKRLSIFDRYILPKGWDMRDVWAEFSAPATAFIFNGYNWSIILRLAEELRKKGKMAGMSVARFLEENSPLGRPERAIPWREY